MPRRRASSRRRTFIFRSSHSSNSRSSAAASPKKSSIVSSVMPRSKTSTLRERVDLVDLARGQHRLVHADLVHPGAQAVHVRQVERVEVGEAEHPADALERERHRRRLADRQPRDADRERAELVLLLARDLVAIAAGSELFELARREARARAAATTGSRPSSRSARGSPPACSSARREARSGDHFVPGVRVSTSSLIWASMGSWTNSASPRSTSSRTAARPSASEASSSRGASPRSPARDAASVHAVTRRLPSSGARRARAEARAAGAAPSCSA